MKFLTLSKELLVLDWGRGSASLWRVLIPLHEDEGNDNEWKWLSPSNNEYSVFGIGWVKYEKSLQKSIPTQQQAQVSYQVHRPGRTHLYQGRTN
jgi:hypothetical protein